MSNELGFYIELIEGFLEGSIPAATFERRYLDHFQADQTRRDEELFDVLDGLFAAVDAYCGDDELRPHVKGAIDESELRLRAGRALGVLRGSG